MKSSPTESQGLTKVTIAQISASILGTIFWLILAVTIHPLAYGHLSWMISIAMILSTVCLLGLGKTIVTYYPKEGNKELLSSSAVIVLLLSLGMGTIVSIVLEPPTGLLIVGFSVFSIAVYSELGMRQYENYMWTWIGVRTTALVLPLFIYYISGLIAGIMAGLFAAYFIFGSWALKHLPHNLSLRDIKTKLDFTLSSWGADIGRVSVNFLDKVIVGALFGMVVLGYYQFAYRIFAFFGILPQILFFYLLPEKSAGKKTKRIEIFGIIAALGLASLIFLLSPHLIPQIFPNFTEGVKPIQIMGLAIIPATISRIKTSDLYSRERAKAVFSSNFLALGVGIVGIVWLGETYGLIGLALSLLAIKASLAAGLFLIPKLLDWGENGKITLSLIGMVIVTALLLSFAGAQEPRVDVQDGEIRGTGIAMDTSVSITVMSDNTDVAKDAVQKAFDEINRVEDLMSSELGTSEIYALNNCGTDWIDLSPEVTRLLKASKRYSDLSDGYFDPTVKPLVDLWMEKVEESGKIPNQSELSEAIELVGYKGIIINENRGEVRLSKRGMEVTLGGIAKGYAVDRACKILSERGIDQALVNIGGDIRAMGSKSWTVAIQHPRKERDYLGKIELENAAIATSGDYRRFFLLGSRRIHHIINPKNGQPATEAMSVTVIADNCLAADALSTSIFAAGPEKGMALLNTQALKGIIVTPEENVIKSDSWNFKLGTL